jgi:hypothetical protein
MRPFALTLASTLALAIVPGCGGNGETDLFSGGSDAPADAGAFGLDGASQDRDGATPAGDGDAVDDVSAIEASGPDADAMVETDAADVGTSDAGGADVQDAEAGHDAGDDGASQNDAGGAVTAGVACGSSTCSPGVACCVTNFPAPGARCSSGPTGCFGATSVACDESPDCGGRVCCASRVGFIGNAYKIDCADSCTGTGDQIACQDSSQCDAGKSCKGFQAIAGYKTCQ